MSANTKRPFLLSWLPTRNNLLISASSGSNETGDGTFQIQVLGSVDILCDGLCVHLQCVCVGGVPRDNHVVPLVVIERVVAVPLQQARPVPQVKHVVDETGKAQRDSRRGILPPRDLAGVVCSPFHQLHRDEVVAVSTVEEEEAVGRRGFELKEQVHGSVGLQGGQAQVAALRLEGHRVGDDEAHAEAGVQLAEVDVPILAHVDVLHAVELEALWEQKTGRMLV